MSDEDFGLDFLRESSPPLSLPTVQTFTRLNGEILHIRLVGESPLWGHLLWSASKVLVNYMDQNPALVKGRDILELGAAGALPSIVCSRLGARSVVITDYPDPELIDNIEFNKKQCCENTSEVYALGYIWGRDPVDLVSKTNGRKFQTILLSDLIFNHQAHTDLLKTCKECLSHEQNSQVLVFFTHHRPHLASKDNSFFELARSFGFTVTRVVEDMADENVMFRQDPGSSIVRATVHGFSMCL